MFCIFTVTIKMLFSDIWLRTFLVKWQFNWGEQTKWKSRLPTRKTGFNWFPEKEWNRFKLVYRSRARALSDNHENKSRLLNCKSKWQVLSWQVLSRSTGTFSTGTFSNFRVGKREKKKRLKIELRSCFLL